MKVRAIRTHTQPGSNIYRETGSEFDHNGPLYRHVEQVDAEEPETKPAAETKAKTKAKPETRATSSAA